MKIPHPLAVVLFMSAFGLCASAQENSEIASLHAKAVKGNGIAQYNLGLAYAEGRGVAADPIEAYVWLSLARDNGARGRALDNVAASLDKAALDLARQRTAERRIAIDGGSPAAPAATAAAPAAREVAPAAPGEDQAAASFRNERDALAVRVNNLAAELAALRSERERLIKLSADNEKAAQAAAEASRSAEARVTELVQANQATKAELEASRQFGRQVEETLNKVDDEKARVAAQAAAELAAARSFGQQVETTLNKVNDQKAALETQLAALTQAKVAAEQALAAKSGAPSYPDLSGRVRELETALSAARNSVPAYPDLRTRVAELETQFTAAQNAAAEREAQARQLAQEVKRADLTVKQTQESYGALQAEADRLRAQQPAAPAYPDLSGRVTELEAALAAARNAQPAYPDLRRQVAELETKVTDMAAAANASQQQFAALTQAKAAAEQALAAKPAAPAYPDLSGRVGELEKALADASRQLVTQSAEAARTSQEMAALTKAKEDAQNAKPAAPAYPDLSGRVKELETAVAASLRKLGATEQSRAEISQQFDDYKGATAAAQRERTTLQATLKMLESDKTALRRQLEASSAETSQLRTQVAALKIPAPAPKNPSPAYPDLSGRVGELETALTASKQEAQTQLGNLTAERDAARTAQNELRDTVARMEQEKAEQLAAKPAAPAYPDLSGRVNELEARLAQAGTDLSAASSAKADLSGRVGELEAALAARSSEADTAKAEVVALTKAKEEAKNAAPAYPNLTDKVAELETKLAGAEKSAAEKPAAPAYPDLSGKVADLNREVTQLRSDRERMQKLLADSGRQLAEATAASRSRPVAPPGYVERMHELEAQLAEAKTAAQPAAPAYPDLSGRVKELEAQLAAKPAAPSFPDLSAKVAELETALAAAQQQPAAAPAAGDPAELEKKLAATEDRLATSLRGYAALQRERDTLAADAAKSAAAVTAERDSLAGQVASLTGQVEQLRTAAQSSSGSTQAELARLNEAVTALQRTTAQSSQELAAARALTQQLQGANAVLAGENYQLKTGLVRTSGGPAAPAPVTVPGSAPGARVHVVVAGDSLSRLSQRYYGNAGRWQDIYNANAALLGPSGVLRIGTELRIP